MNDQLIEIARRCFQAYADSDREAIEALIAPEMRFTSPLDNQLDRTSYFERCWPNNEHITAFDLRQFAVNGSSVFVIYEGLSTDGHRFRNCEKLTISKNQITAVEVYFGWNLPHKAAQGSWVATP